MLKDIDHASESAEHIQIQRTLGCEKGNETKPLWGESNFSTEADIPSLQRNAQDHTNTNARDGLDNSINLYAITLGLKRTREWEASLCVFPELSEPQPKALRCDRQELATAKWIGIRETAR